LDKKLADKERSYQSKLEILGEGETESTQVAAQNQALSKNYFRKNSEKEMQIM
jgi:hypothetical protein